MTGLLVETATSIIESAQRSGATARLFGSLAVKLLAPETVPRPAPRDIDMVCLGREILVVLETIRGHGFDEDMALTRLFGTERRRLTRAADQVRLDLCIDRLRFCRPIPVADRLQCRKLTLPVSDLLLSKLQNRNLDVRDVADCVNLLLAFEPGDAEGDACFDLGRMVGLCGRDWSLEHLVMEGLSEVERSVGLLPGHVSELVLVRIGRIRSAIKAGAKTLAWRVRSLLGERVRWYDEVSEF